MAENFFRKIVEWEGLSKGDKSESIADQGFKKGSIDHPNQPEGGRNLEVYEQDLMFNRQELENKVVLDLGAGPQAKLAKQLKEAGIHASVIEFSPDFSSPEHAQKAKESLPDGNFVAGVGQSLPFKNDSFDRVLALHVAEHLTQDTFSMVFLEIARVLKGGGQGKVGPIAGMPEGWNPLRDVIDNKKLIQKINKLGVDVIKEDIPGRAFTVWQDMGMKHRIRWFNIVLSKKEVL